MSGIVLSFELNQDENETLMLLCAMAGAKLRAVSSDEYSKNIGELVQKSLDFSVGASRGKLGDKMLVFSNVNDSQLEMLLSGIRALDIAKGSYKAVVTENNSKWTPYELISELRRERAEIEGTKA